MAIQLHASFAVHPGRWVKTELVEPAGLNVTTVAAALKVSRQAMSNLLNGNAGVSADMALRLEKAFGVQADTLMRMQAAFDLAEARATDPAAHIQRLNAA